ncbi:MAG: hypothetical protein GF320_10725 [Armatimonadia bacterium]|nr:hypothetical protein [Armatimonadia bacterium]
MTIEGMAGPWAEVLTHLSEVLQVVVMTPRLSARGLSVPPGSAAAALSALSEQCNGSWEATQGVLCLRTAYAHAPTVIELRESMARAVGRGASAEVDIALAIGADPDLLSAAAGEGGLVVSDLPGDTRAGVINAMTRLNSGVSQHLTPWRSTVVAMRPEPALLLVTALGEGLSHPIPLAGISAGRPRLYLQDEAWARASAAEQELPASIAAAEGGPIRSLSPAGDVFQIAELIGDAEATGERRGLLSVATDVGEHEVFVAAAAAVDVPHIDLAAAVAMCCPWLELRHLEDLYHLGLSEDGKDGIWRNMWHEHGPDKALMSVCQSLYRDTATSLPPSPFVVEDFLRHRSIPYSAMSPEQRVYIDSAFEGVAEWQTIDRTGLSVLLLPSLQLSLTQGETALTTEVRPLSHWMEVPTSIVGRN